MQPRLQTVSGNVATLRAAKPGTLQPILITFGHAEAADGSLVTLSGDVAGAAKVAYSEAFGTDVVEVGQGGSIPLVGAFQKAFPNAAVLVTGVVDPDSRMHGIDESFDLSDFTSACIAEATLLARLAPGA